MQKIYRNYRRESKSFRKLTSRPRFRHTKRSRHGIKPARISTNYRRRLVAQNWTFPVRKKRLARYQQNLFRWKIIRAIPVDRISMTRSTNQYWDKSRETWLEQRKQRMPLLPLWVNYSQLTMGWAS